MDLVGAKEATFAIHALQPESFQANLWAAQSLLQEGRSGEAEPYLVKAIAIHDQDSADGVITCSVPFTKSTEI